LLLPHLRAAYFGEVELGLLRKLNAPDRRSAAKLLSKDEAQRITANIVKLPGLLGKP